MIPLSRLALFLIAALVVFAGCGQKGPLVLPDKAPPAEDHEEPR
jgi:predicted small lipoprotein YifL